VSDTGDRRTAGRHDDHSLPVPTDALVGRDDEVRVLDRLLADPTTQLLTLTGPPGVGKTRLALAAAAGATPHFADGVTFVDLSDIRDPDLVPAAVLDAVGRPDGSPEALARPARALRGTNMLLVVDNFEHLLDAGPSVAAALARSPGLKLLATSRERLNLRVEREVPVRPLELPPPAGALSTTVPSMNMLVQCVRRFEPGFEVTPANHAALAEICIRLDGLPLALELAAARLKLFTPGELAFRLRHRMNVLIGTVRDVPRRHRTLRAALAWSHDLLKPDERTAFRRLSVFVGGATLDAAGHVCDLDDPVTTIASLVDKSLLHRRIRPDGGAEFVMLQSLREYAAERLAERGEEEAVHTRHARYFADLAMLVEAAIGEALEVAWVESVRFEQGNLRKALAHATAAGDTGLSLPLASALGWYASGRGRLGKSVTADRALADPGQQPAGCSLARATLIAAVLALGRGDLDDAEALLTRVLAVDEDQRHTAVATAFLGHLARARGHPDQAVGHHARAADMFAEVGNTSGVAWSRFDLALLARHRGDADAAASHLRESLTRFREVGDTRAVACATRALVTVQNRPRAVSALRPAVDGRRRDGARPVAALTTRERQVARLVADGSTNRQIARALGIAEKTTEAHVHNIIHKLGAPNRAAVAARVSAPDAPD
jgi:predicted ATPase/DNA-binding CsgD family transcriptional regulator